MAKIEKFIFNGHEATVIIPDNPNGKWLWKAEYLDAFEEAEVKLSEMGYTRVYYRLVNTFGSYRTVRKMHNFHAYVTKKYNLNQKCCLVGMSIGGLFSFNFTLAYPELVEKVWLDNPVLNFEAWPPKGSDWQNMLLEEYSISQENVYNFKDKPVDNLEEFFSHKIPVLLIAAQKDEVVSFEMCSKRMIDYCKENNIDIKVILKPEGLHHPHSLEDVTPIIDFIVNG